MAIIDLKDISFKSPLSPIYKTTHQVHVAHSTCLEGLFLFNYKKSYLISKN